MPNRTVTSPARRRKNQTVHSTDQHAHVQHRLQALAEEAAAQRLAASQRRLHREEHEAHPALVHDHAAGGMRGTLGRMLIGLGTAIAGSGSGVRRAA